MNKYKEMKAKFDKLREDIQAESEKFFNESADELFEKYPDLLGFGWKQYTPYFNDGDECVFSADTDDPDLLFSKDLRDKITSAYELAEIDEPETSDDWYEGYDFPKNKYWSDGEYHNIKKYPILASKIHKEVCEFLKTLDDDNYKVLFGDHVTVKVTRNGIEIEEYEHD